MLLLPHACFAVCLHPLPPNISSFYSVFLSPPPLFSKHSVECGVKCHPFTCNRDTSSSVGLALHSPYLLRLHSVSPPQSAPEAQQNRPSFSPSSTCQPILLPCSRPFFAPLISLALIGFTPWSCNNDIQIFVSLISMSKSSFHSDTKDEIYTCALGL